MRLRKVFVVLFAVLLPFAVSAQVIRTDANVRVGKLKNGLTYYIRYNNRPENRADFYIAQKVGSVNEDESQRGLAHFLEHMCFNGTKNFPGNSVISYMETLGTHPQMRQSIVYVTFRQTISRRSTLVCLYCMTGVMICCSRMQK